MTATSNEIWKPVVGHEGAYEVSDQGRVRSLDRTICATTRWGTLAQRLLRGRTLRGTDNGRGYFQVSLCDETGRRVNNLIHRLVAQTFLPEVRGKTHVNHINGDKSDNRASNLEWCSRSENMQHAHDTGLLDPYSVPVIGTCVFSGRETRYEKQTDAEIALSGTGRPSSAINHCLVGKKKTAYGHVWRRA